MSLKGDLIAVGIGGAVLLAAGWYAKKKIGDAASSVAETVAEVAPYVNPADDRNVVNQAVTGFYQKVTGSTGTIGGDLYDANNGGILTDVQWWQWANPATALGTATAGAIKQSSVGQTVKSWWDSL